MAEVRGIDISEKQGTVNWDRIDDAVQAGDISFVSVRAGFGVQTSGGRDDEFTRNWTELRARGISRNAYFFAYPGRSSGTKQADDFHAIVGDLRPGESLMLDMEDEPIFGRILNAGDVAWAVEFLNRAKDLFGLKPLVYMNSDLKDRFNWSPVESGDFGLWLADYGTNNGQPQTRPAPAPWDAWSIWQFTSRGNTAGITPVDTNIFNGPIDAFLRFGKQDNIGRSNVRSTTRTQPPPPASAGFDVGRPTPGYVTAADAAARRNSNSTVAAGHYAVFNRSQGMVNVTRQAGTPGSWINPGDLA
jgi:GH25 family lysozyme M1 (1,4-beta-N-acetylmuramidase)